MYSQTGWLCVRNFQKEAAKDALGKPAIEANAVRFSTKGDGMAKRG